LNEEFYIREWHNTTTMHPLGLLAIALLGCAMLIVKRRNAVLPMLAMSMYVSVAQRIVVAGLDFNFIRIMVIFGWVRVLMWREYTAFRWTKLDVVMLAWALSGAVIYTIQQGNTSGLIYKLGTTYDSVGMYFLFRMLIRSWADVVSLMRGLVWLSVPIVMAFVLENRTGRNMFSVLGGVPEITVVRDGRIRARGAFSHPILAGTYWAAIVPTITALWWRGGKDRLYASVGTFNCLLLVVLCASSTPVAAVGFGMLAAMLWTLRHWMGMVQAAIVLGIVALHMTMEAPVWHLVSRIDLVGGSTGWHRYFLFDQFIRHFQEWAVIGTPSTAHWGIVDITNQYVLEGIRGGLLTLALFLLSIAIAFREVGRMVRLNSGNRWKAIFAWACGVSLFVHATAYFAVSYFGQIIMIWYLLLAVIVGLRQASAVSPTLGRASPGSV